MFPCIPPVFAVFPQYDLTCTTHVPAMGMITLSGHQLSLESVIVRENMCHFVCNFHVDLGNFQTGWYFYDGMHEHRVRYVGPSLRVMSSHAADIVMLLYKQ